MEAFGPRFHLLHAARVAAWSLLHGFAAGLMNMAAMGFIEMFCMRTLAGRF